MEEKKLNTFLKENGPNYYPVHGISTVFILCTYRRSKCDTLLVCHSRRIRRCPVGLLGHVSYCHPKTVPSVPLPPPTVELYRRLKKT